MPSLLFVAGPLAGRRVEVTAQVVVGRDDGVDVVVEDPEISRRHAVLRASGDAVEVEDLGSLNGTWVNGSRIAGRVLLAPGDVVQLGATRLQLPPLPAPAAGTPAAPDPGPAPAAPPAAPAAAPPAAPAAGVAVPGGAAMPAFTPPPPPVARGIATSRLTPTVLAVAVVVATALALVAYFAAR